MNDYKVSVKKKSIQPKLRFAIFIGGDAPNFLQTKKFFQKNKFDIVIVADSGIDTLQKISRELQKEISVDVILGDFDSIQNKKCIKKFPIAKIKTFPKDKDFTDTELAIVEAFKISKEKKCKAHITIFGGSGGERIDHTLLVYDSFSEKKHADRWLSKTQSIYFFPKNTIAKIASIYKNDIISIARLTKSRSRGKIFSRELKWNNFRLHGMPSISNRVDEKIFAKKKCVEIFAREENFLLIVPLDAVVEFRQKDNLPNLQKKSQALRTK